MKEEEIRDSQCGEEEDTLILPPLPSHVAADLPPDLPPDLSAPLPPGGSASAREGADGLPPLPPSSVPSSSPEPWKRAEEDAGWNPLPPPLPQATPPARSRVNGWALLWVALAVATCLAGKGFQQQAARENQQAAVLGEGNRTVQEKVEQSRQRIREQQEARQKISKLEEEIKACQKENEKLWEELRRYELEVTPLALREQVQQLEREKSRALQYRAEREEREARQRAAERPALKAPNLLERLEAHTPVAHEEEATPQQKAHDARIMQLVSTNFRARTKGDVELMRSIFDQFVCYQYLRYRAVNRECVVQDIVEGWAKWPVRRYELLQVGTDGKQHVEVIFRYSLRNPMTRASTSGYSKEHWIVEDNGKISLWEEEVSKKSPPKGDGDFSKRIIQKK